MSVSPATAIWAFVSGKVTSNGGAGMIVADIMKKISSKNTTLIIGTTDSATGRRGGMGNRIALFHHHQLGKTSALQDLCHVKQTLNRRAVRAAQNNRIVPSGR